MTQIEKAGQRIAEELKKLDKLSRNIKKEYSAEERKAARKSAWNLQEQKRKEAQARSQEVTKNAMDKIKAKLEKLKDKTIEQKIAEGAFNEDQRMIQRVIIPKVW